jgi:hypothetical protein
VTYNGWKIEAEELRAERDALRRALEDLTRDCMASDFNEHWDSYKAAVALTSATKG